MRIITDAEIIVRIRAASNNGLAPSSFKEQSLYSVSCRRFGSWKAACAKAGVRPRASRRVDVKYNERTDLLAKSLHMAARAGRTDVFMECAKYVRGELSN